ncbi:hypothetical protein KIL84_018299 [Mauremys mutica]|uniref:Uncharacterized protein n=1 Tax=Mauremys mutica TaxID=74926 RepID=A0A9D4B9K2_9SAUR|nr:hypothetical protein KIL84_018299 [Mauremys mutica]
MLLQPVTTNGLHAEDLGGTSLKKKTEDEKILQEVAAYLKEINDNSIDSTLGPQE